MRIGIDLGGTKIEVVAMANDHKILYRTRVPTPQGDYKATLDAIRALAEKAEAAAGKARGIGVGTPGSISPVTHLMQNCNSTCLNGKDLLADLESILAAPVRIANDADCFALSEAQDGAGKGFSSVFGIILGTGVGGGLVINGQLLEGPNALVGEWGHNPLALPGADRPCYCGHNNCVETWISGPAIEKEFTTLGGPALSAAAIATSSDPLAVAAVDSFLNRLAQALGSVVNLVDPACIVLGGGLSNIERIYAELPSRLVGHIMPDTCLTALKKAEHGDSSGIRGAAWLWP